MYDLHYNCVEPNHSFSSIVIAKRDYIVCERDQESKNKFSVQFVSCFPEPFDPDIPLYFQKTIDKRLDRSLLYILCLSFPHRLNAPLPFQPFHLPTTLFRILLPVPMFLYILSTRLRAFLNTIPSL